MAVYNTILVSRIIQAQCVNTQYKSDKMLLKTMVFVGAFALLQAAKCPKIRDLSIKNGGHHCCENIFKQFRQSYHNSNFQLTNFLEKLRAWNCSQFEKECEQRYFDFNRFTSLVYDRFCDMKAFEKNCKQELEIFDESNYTKRNSGKTRYLQLKNLCTIFLIRYT